MSDLTERLNNLRKQTDLSVTDIARATGVTRAAADKWFKGTSVPSDERVEALSSLFRVTPAYIKYGDVVMESCQTLDVSPTEISIPLLTISGSCGDGGNCTDIGLVKMIRVEEEWLRKNAVGSYDRRYLHVITASGDSMNPTIESGDFVIVDSSQKRVTRDGIYVLEYSGSVFIKRVQIFPGDHASILSDNPRYKPYDIDDLDQLHVIGRCILTLKPNPL